MKAAYLEKKTEGLTFLIAAEEMRRLKSQQSVEEKLRLYGLYKQGVHGNIPTAIDYPPPLDEWASQKWAIWKSLEAMPKTVAQEKYVAVAAKLIEKYGRKIVRSM